MPTPPIPAELDDFLSKPNPSVIATVRPDGSPHTAATWYAWEDGRILVNMDEGRKRLDYIRNEPRVSLTVLSADDWHTHVSLQGRVVELVDDPELVDIDRLSQHYRGQQYHNRKNGRVSAWIEIERWHGWHAGRAWQ